MSRYPYTAHPLRDDPDADGLIEKPDADFSNCGECFFEFKKTVLNPIGICPQCEIKLEIQRRIKLALALTAALEKFNAAFYRSGKFMPVKTDTRDPHTVGVIAEIADSNGRQDIALEIRNVIFLMNPPQDEDISKISSAEKTVDCLKPTPVAPTGAGK
jgi:hypothetical protein